MAFRYECTNPICREAGYHEQISEHESRFVKTGVSWSESYVNARANELTIKDREEVMSRLHGAATRVAGEHKVRRVKIK